MNHQTKFPYRTPQSPWEFSISGISLTLEARFSELILYLDVIYKGDPREVKSVLLDSFLSLLGAQEVTEQSGILQDRESPWQLRDFLSS